MAFTWIAPRLFLWLISNISLGHPVPPPLFMLEISERIRPVLAATSWSCLAGAFRMAHLHVRGERPGPGDFIGGFFGGFLFLLPAILWEVFLPDRVLYHEPVVFLLLPLWPVGSAFLAAMGAKTPMLKCFPVALRLLEGRYWQWLGMEAVLAGLLILGAAPGGLGLPIVMGLRVLTISVAVRDLFPVESESLSSPTP
jgi:hypothetical protein